MLGFLIEIIVTFFSRRLQPKILSNRSLSLRCVSGCGFKGTTLAWPGESSHGMKTSKRVGVGINIWRQRVTQHTNIIISKALCLYYWCVYYALTIWNSLLVPPRCTARAKSRGLYLPEPNRSLLEKQIPIRVLCSSFSPSPTVQRQNTLGVSLASHPPTRLLTRMVLQS